MTDKEKFARFKNSLLGPTFLNDGNHFASVLGRSDFQFWSHIQEKAPYLPAVEPVPQVIKGQVILERIEIEPSPRRMADLLQAIYNAFAFYSITPHGRYDDHWKQFATWLQSHINNSGMAYKLRWLKAPEEDWTVEFPQEKYYIPGDLEISYSGENWADAKSKLILENGFASRILEAWKSAPKVVAPTRKPWYERPIGMIVIGVATTVIASGIIYLIGT